jgi:transcriptional regulator with XRE-family HTH domain
MELFEYVGQKLRTLRTNNPSGRPYSQEGLAKALGIAPNTVSRWETATYKPSIKDLDKVARLFNVSILEFFPREEHPKDEKIAALLRTAKQLDPGDLEEVRRFAEFRKATRVVKEKGSEKGSRRPGTRAAK